MCLYVRIQLEFPFLVFLVCFFFAFHNTYHNSRCRFPNFQFNIHCIIMNKAKSKLIYKRMCRDGCLCGYVLNIGWYIRSAVYLKGAEFGTSISFKLCIHARVIFSRWMKSNSIRVKVLNGMDVRVVDWGNDQCSLYCKHMHTPTHHVHWKFMKNPIHLLFSAVPA